MRPDGSAFAVPSKPEADSGDEIDHVCILPRSTGIARRVPNFPRPFDPNVGRELLGHMADEPGGTFVRGLAERVRVQHGLLGRDFDDIELSVVDIQKGDNFWKIARDNGVNIDTLIGANPHWDSLTARVKQRIIVPSRPGVLNFINDRSEIDEIAELYGVERSKIMVQKLPPLHWFFSRFQSERRPVAIFVEGARPTTHTMTPDMAKKYALREMFRSPLAGRFTSHFGGRTHPIFKQYGFHNGVDIATAHGTPVGASCGGVVTAAGWMGGYGKAVIIDHPKGYRTLYGHLSSNMLDACVGLLLVLQVTKALPCDTV